MQFSIDLMPIYIPTNSAQVGFLHNLTGICYILPFDSSHSNKHEVMFHCDFDLHFPNINDVEHFLCIC